MDDYQYLRKASLIIAGESEVLDVSELRFRFQVKAMDTQSPNHADIRIYNLSQDTVTKIRGEYTRVILQVGYNDDVGVIFDGTIKQFRSGRETSMDTYLDLLAADGDLAYNLALINKTLAAGSTIGERLNAAAEAMRTQGLVGSQVMLDRFGGVLPRGKVLFGLPRAVLSQTTRSVGATWSIQQGVLKVLPKDGYLPNQVVVLNGQTGLIGRAEQTVDGIKARCLINPNIQIGARVQIDNKAINQLIHRAPEEGPIPYNQWAGTQLIANTSADGIYRVLVAEHEGDTRGNNWYTDLTLLSIDPTTDKVTSP